MCIRDEFLALKDTLSSHWTESGYPSSTNGNQRELSDLHGINLHGALEALHALGELLASQVQEAFGALGAGAAVLGQLPGLVIVTVVAKDIAKQAVQAGRFLFLQLLPKDFFCLEKKTEIMKLLFFLGYIHLFPHVIQNFISKV